MNKRDSTNMTTMMTKNNNREKDPVDEDDETKVWRSLSDLCREDERLTTFKNWNNVYVKPSDLAREGMFFSKTEDLAICFFCAGNMSGWKENEDPKTRHAKQFPSCNFVRGLDVGNVRAAAHCELDTPAKINRTLEKDCMRFESLRLRTFATRSFVKEEQEIASASSYGFYYLGYFGHDSDLMRCFSCRQTCCVWKFSRIDHDPSCCYVSRNVSCKDDRSSSFFSFDSFYEPKCLDEEHADASVEVVDRSARSSLFDSFDYRFHSFKDCWPIEKQVNSYKLARAGFYYIGWGDYIRCFRCGGGLRNLDRGDNILALHRKHFPFCLISNQINEITKAKYEISCQD